MSFVWYSPQQAILCEVFLSEVTHSLPRDIVLKVITKRLPAGFSWETFSTAQRSFGSIDVFHLQCAYPASVRSLTSCRYFSILFVTQMHFEVAEDIGRIPDNLLKQSKRYGRDELTRTCELALVKWLSCKQIALHSPNTFYQWTYTAGSLELLLFSVQVVCIALLNQCYTATPSIESCWRGLWDPKLWKVGLCLGNELEMQEIYTDWEKPNGGKPLWY